MSGPERVGMTVAGQELVPGSRVRIRPRGGADIFDLALVGRTAVVDTIEEDLEGRIHVAVTIDDDPGRDLGVSRQLGHRFFFSVDEIEPLPAADPDGTARRVLVAGIGNIFRGDDGFGVEVVQRLARQAPRPGVDIVDFGIRGMDLCYALQDGYRTVILVDAAPRGRQPGTVSLIEPDPGELDAMPVDGHGMDPVAVLRLAKQSGDGPERILLVACEPTDVDPDADLDGIELSAPVRAAVDEAVELIAQLLAELCDEQPKEGVPS